MTDTTQAVVDEADTKPVAGSEAESARTTTEDDLDKLLADYDTQNKPAAPASPIPQPQAPQQPDELAMLKSEVQNLKTQAAKWADAEFRQEIQSTIKEVRGDLDPEFFDDDLVEAWLDRQARKDPRLAEAWRDPKMRPRINGQLSKQFSKKYSSQPDRQATEDKAAVVHAMRSASTRQPESQPEDYSRLSTQEFREKIRKDFGFDPGV